MLKSKKQVICTDINKKKHRVALSSLTFCPSAYGILINNGKILLSKQRGDGYDFPGGGIEIEETAEAAVVREFYEETGFKVRPLQVIDVVSKMHRSNRRKENWNWIGVYYTVKKLSGKISTANFADSEKHYIDAAEWIDLRKIKKIKFYTAANGPKLIAEAIRMSK